MRKTASVSAQAAIQKKNDAVLPIRRFAESSPDNSWTISESRFKRFLIVIFFTLAKKSLSMYMKKMPINSTDCGRVK